MRTSASSVPNLLPWESPCLGFGVCSCKRPFDRGVRGQVRLPRIQVAGRRESKTSTASHRVYQQIFKLGERTEWGDRDLEREQRKLSRSGSPRLRQGSPGAGGRSAPRLSAHTASVRVRPSLLRQPDGRTPDCRSPESAHSRLSPAPVRWLSSRGSASDREARQRSGNRGPAAYHPRSAPRSAPQSKSAAPPRLPPPRAGNTARIAP